MLRELLERTLVTALVAAVYAAPLVLAGMSSPFALPPELLAPAEGDEAEEEGEWLAVPDAAMLLADVAPDEVVADVPAPTPVEPILPPAADAKAIAADPRPAGDAAPGLPNAGEGAAAGVPDGTGHRIHVVRGEGDGDGDGAARRPRRAKKSKCDDPHPHVRVADDGVVEIDRSLVDEYTRNLETFMKLGYSHPYDENDVHGWYIGGFACTSPVAKAGFKRGDVLLSVNGKKTRSWVGVFLVYQKLKNKAAFEIDLVRRGEPLTLHFRVNEQA